MTTQEETEALIQRLRNRDAVVMSGLYHAIPAMREAADEIERLSAAARGMREALEKAAEQFAFYEREHHAKGDAATLRGNEAVFDAARAKAETNGRFATMCRAALSPNRPLAGEEK